jgi:CubicO group peptidase (beta-lactamase class C family)
MPTPDALSDLQAVLDAAVQKAGLPGAGLAVLLDGEIVEAASGVLNTRTGVEVTTDSVFQIGSVTKVYTATLVMQLVDAGLVDLDVPVRTYVPEFRVADADATESITVRQLLTHTSGFDGGDHFVDTGRGDDCVARYVEGLGELEQLTAPGALWSYNNAGFTVLGRLIELVTGQVWDDALRDRLLAPAGLVSSMTLPEEALLFRTAAGHVLGDDGKPVPVKRWAIDRSGGPAGAIVATPADVLGFGRIHLDDGRSASGDQLLSPASVKAMQEEQIRMTGGAVGFGLGWMLGETDGERTISHNGGTLGQSAFFHVLPDRGFAICLLTNGPTGALVWQAVTTHVFDKALGLQAPKPGLPPVPEEAPDLDLTKYEGRYERRAVHTTCKVVDGALTATIEYVGVPYDLKPPPPMPLRAVDESTFVAFAGEQPAMAMHFLDFDDDGRPSLLFAARVARRVTRSSS